MNTIPAISLLNSLIEGWRFIAERYLVPVNTVRYGAIVLTILCVHESFAQGVGISESSFTPDPTAILELKSTLRGLLPPRMTVTQRDIITSPATGLAVYNTTTNRLNLFDGTSWNPVTATTDNLGVFSSTASAQFAGVLSDETGTGLAVFSNSPSLTTPTLGAATATSINKVTVIAPATSATLVLVDGSTLATSGANSITLTSTGATNVTLPTSGTLATVREMAQLSADVTITSTALGDVNGMANYSLDANSTYYFKFRCLITTNGTGVGILLSLNASAAIASINYIHMYPTSATAFTYQQVAALQGGMLPITGPGATVREYTLEGTVVTTSAVTLALQSRSETGAIVTVKAGSFGWVKKIL